MSSVRTFCLTTLGCKVNQYDTQLIREQFLERGYREVGWGQPADVYVINTCTVTQTSDQKSLQRIKQAAKLTPRPKIVVTGCYVHIGREKLAGIKEIDYIFTNEQKESIAEVILSSVDSYNGKIDDYRHDLTKQISNFKGHNRVFVKVQEGCNSFCSYCIVPYVRGRSRSKDPELVEKEIFSLAQAGFKEIVISGVHLGDYGKDLPNGVTLTTLIDRIKNIEGIRIRLSSIEPLEVEQELIDCIKNSRNVCRHLHLPLQSGDGHILKRMRRPYTPGQYLRLVRNIKKQIEDISLTTDIMVGFPGEDEKAFENTLKLVKEVGYSRIHVFPYSRRPFTPAYKFDSQLEPNVIKERVNRLKEIGRQVSLQYRQKFLGRTVYPLVESRRDKKTGLLAGYTDTYIRVLMKGEDELKNTIVPAEVIEVTPEETIVKKIIISE